MEDKYDQTIYSQETQSEQNIERGSVFTTWLFSDEELSKGLIYFHRIYLNLI